MDTLFPLVHKLQRLLHFEKVIGDVHRVFWDFGLNQNLAFLGPESRLKNPALGAGTLLDIGIYSLTWGLLALESGPAVPAEKPEVFASQSLSHGIDVATSIILRYPDEKTRHPNIVVFHQVPRNLLQDRRHVR